MIGGRVSAGWLLGVAAAAGVVGCSGGDERAPPLVGGRWDGGSVGGSGATVGAGGADDGGSLADGAGPGGFAGDAGPGTGGTGATEPPAGGCDAFNAGAIHLWTNSNPVSGQLGILLPELKPDHPCPGYAFPSNPVVRAADLKLVYTAFDSVAIRRSFIMVADDAWGNAPFFTPPHATLNDALVPTPSCREPALVHVAPNFNDGRVLYNCEFESDDRNVTTCAEAFVQQDRHRVCASGPFYDAAGDMVTDRTVLGIAWDGRLVVPDENPSWPTAAAIGFYQPSGDQITHITFTTAPTATKRIAARAFLGTEQMPGGGLWFVLQDDAGDLELFEVLTTAPDAPTGKSLGKYPAVPPELTPDFLYPPPMLDASGNLYVRVVDETLPADDRASNQILRLDSPTASAPTATVAYKFRPNLFVHEAIVSQFSWMFSGGTIWTAIPNQ